MKQSIRIRVTNIPLKTDLRRHDIVINMGNDIKNKC